MFTIKNNLFQYVALALERHNSEKMHGHQIRSWAT